MWKFCHRGDRHQGRPRKGKRDRDTVKKKASKGPRVISALGSSEFNSSALRFEKGGRKDSSSQQCFSETVFDLKGSHSVVRACSMIGGLFQQGIPGSMRSQILGTVWESLFESAESSKVCSERSIYHRDGGGKASKHRQA